MGTLTEDVSTADQYGVAGGAEAPGEVAPRLDVAPRGGDDRAAGARSSPGTP